MSANGGKIVLELAMPESSRKFITCVRKYLLLYLSLCERTGDISTLERAHVNLRADKKVISIYQVHVSGRPVLSYVPTFGGLTLSDWLCGCKYFAVLDLFGGHIPYGLGSLYTCVSHSNQYC